MYLLLAFKWKDLLCCHIVKNNEDGMLTPILTNNLKGNNHGNMKNLKKRVTKFVFKHYFSYSEMKIEYLF